MSAQPFLYRDELVWFVGRHAPSRSIRRACVEGEVEVLGGFHCLPPTGRPGFVVQVKSRHDTFWNLSVIANEVRHTWHVRGMVDPIPWKHWCDATMGTCYSLYVGDHPKKYRGYKNAAP